MPRTKLVDLENGYELVVKGDYDKCFDGEQFVLGEYGSESEAEIFIRSKRGR